MYGAALGTSWTVLKRRSELLFVMAYRPSQPHPAASARLDEELWRFANLVGPDEREARQRRDVVGRTSALVHQVFPWAEVVVTGSTATGLALPTSDVDLMLMLSVRKVQSEAEVKQERLASLRQLLPHVRRMMAAPGSATLIPAKVPIVNFIDRQTGLSVDVSANCPGSAHNTAVTLQMIGQYPVLRPLLLVLKTLLQQHNLHKTAAGGLGSYLLFVMAQHTAREHSLEGAHPRDAATVLLKFFDAYAHLETLHDVTDPFARGPDGCWMPHAELGAKATCYRQVACLWRGCLARLHSRRRAGWQSSIDCVLLGVEAGLSPHRADALRVVRTTAPPPEPPRLDFAVGGAVTSAPRAAASATTPSHGAADGLGTSCTPSRALWDAASPSKLAPKLPATPQPPQPQPPQPQPPQPQLEMRERGRGRSEDKAPSRRDRSRSRSRSRSPLGANGSPRRRWNTLERPRAIPIIDPATMAPIPLPVMDASTMAPITDQRTMLPIQDGGAKAAAARSATVTTTPSTGVGMGGSTRPPQPPPSLGGLPSQHVRSQARILWEMGE